MWSSQSKMSSSSYRVHAYNFLRDVAFKVFAVNWLSVKFSSSKFHWKNFGLNVSIGEQDTCELHLTLARGWWQISTLPAAATCWDSLKACLGYTFHWIYSVCIDGPLLSHMWSGHVRLGSNMDCDMVHCSPGAISVY